MDDETREEIEYDSEMDAMYDAMYDIWNDIYEDVDAILRKYIDAAPKSNFDDIFDAIDQFVYFNNRVKE